MFTLRIRISSQKCHKSWLLRLNYFLDLEQCTYMWLKVIVESKPSIGVFLLILIVSCAWIFCFISSVKIQFNWMLGFLRTCEFDIVIRHHNNYMSSSWKIFSTFLYIIFNQIIFRWKSLFYEYLYSEDNDDDMQFFYLFDEYWLFIELPFTPMVVHIWKCRFEYNDSSLIIALIMTLTLDRIY